MCTAVVLYHWPDDRKAPKPVVREDRWATATLIVRPYLYWNRCREEGVEIRWKIRETE